MRFGRERLEHEYAQARQQRRVQLERRVLGRRADERDDAGLDGRQERILLRAIEAVDLVAEEDRAAAFDLAALLGFANDLAHARHAFGHGAERHEVLVGVAREQTRERRLAAARRAPEHHARDRALLDRLAQRFAGAEQLLVPQEIVERFGTQPMGERRRRGVAGRGGDGEQRELVGHVFGHLARILLVASPRDAFPVAARNRCYTRPMVTIGTRPALHRHHCGGRGRVLAAGVAGGQEERETHKPALHGKHWVAITGKPLAATAGALTFARGGNAVDAACAMLAAAATMWDTLSWGGETQALIFDPRSGAVRAINALGVAPTGATPEFFRSRGMRGPPEYGPLAAVTPGTPGGLLVMLAEFGTLSLAEVLEPAMQMAAGYPMEQTQTVNIEASKELLVRWESSRRVLLPNLDPQRPQAWAAPLPGADLRAAGAARDADEARRRRARGAQGRQEPQAGDPGGLRALLSRRHRARARRGDAGRRRLDHDGGSRPLAGLRRGPGRHELQGHRRLQAQSLGARPRDAADAEPARERRSASRWATTARATSTRSIKR